ncbi:hypothetical protein AMS68_001997 [Peltaster fructicola]|uniref:RNA-dependent RNA polymerase n=1 Tax=Peltaster fructicola TaxID=286661 RepID=A0A6H0XPS3_9PEZI|nr:hypothetical protein AMS68_001997 [Peltaster fructicola]
MHAARPTFLFLDFKYLKPDTNNNENSNATTSTYRLMPRNNRPQSPAPTSSAERYKAVIARVAQLLNTTIEDRPVNWTPSSPWKGKHHDDEIHKRIQFLMWQDSVSLDNLLQAWEQKAFTSRADPPRINAFLEDLKNIPRVKMNKQPHFTPVRTKTPSTGLTEGLRRTTRTLTRETPFGSTPSSSNNSIPSSNSTAGTTGELETAKTSFASDMLEPATQYGSSWGLETQKHIDAEISFASNTIEPATPYGSSWGPRTQEHISMAIATTPKERSSPKTSTARLSISPPTNKRHDIGSRTARITCMTRASGVQIEGPKTPDSHDDKRRRLNNVDNRPTIVQHQVRDFPSMGFGVTDPLMRGNISWPLKWEILRAFNVLRLEKGVISKIRNLTGLKDIVRAHPKGATFEHSCLQAFAKEQTGPRIPVLTASFLLNESNVGPLFILHPTRIRLDQGCRASRSYGWDRFLYVDFDPKWIPPHIRPHQGLLESKFREWLLQPCHLLGREWRAFELEAKDKKQIQQSKRNSQRDFPFRAVFFAVDGPGLERVELHDFVLRWAVPAKYNLDQPACKAYSRISLVLSRTIPTITFRPHQIRLVEDLRPTTKQDDDPFLDKRYRTTHRLPRKYDADEAMTDGCARISVGAVLLICEQQGLEVIPSAFQARIFGSKGVWYISADPNTSDTNDLDVWIEIRKSQLKVKHCYSLDNLDVVYQRDKTLLSFDVRTYSHPPRSAGVHRDFLQVLESRGVKRSDIMSMAAQCLETETMAMLDAIDDPVRYALLLQKHIDKAPTAGPHDMPVHPANRLSLFLRKGGLMSKSNRFLASEYERLCVMIKLQSLQSIRIPCSQSVMLLGIAHHSDLVPPGKVHISFSTAIEDGSRSRRITNLAGKNVILARDPTLRDSDMQKVQCIFEPKLAHLMDVIVFSSQGSMPGAAKLQGGDYDGDTFWVCWDPILTSDFQNAPVLEPKRWSELGITKDKTKLRDLGPSDGSITVDYCDEFLRHAFEFKLQRTWLGTVTNQYYATSYRTNEISSAAALYFADLHDHLADAAKNGYTLTDATYHEAMKKCGFTVEAAAPAWRAKNQELTKAVRKERLAENRRKIILNFFKDKRSEHSTNILDAVYFGVLLDRAKVAMTQITSKFKDVSTKDCDLRWPYETFVSNSFNDGAACKDLRATAEKEIRNVLNQWHEIWSDRPSRTAAELFELYKKIQPPPSFSWTEIKPAPHAPSLWECIRTSILFDRFHMKDKATFWLDKSVLCFIKAHSESGKRVLEAIEPHLKIKAPKIRETEADVKGLLCDLDPDQEDLDISDYDDFLSNEDLEALYDI